ncbi:MAG TPA: CHASE2 domain-containing protein, partial [Desulfosarcina sp.]|nr:CHASE2 domain-containing protein [Desulfosarcina sp.]
MAIPAAIPAKVRVNRMLLALAGGLLSVLLVLPVWRLGWLETWEGRTWDWRARLLARPGAATPEIVLVLVDQNSLDWGKEVNDWPWPWPREVTGAMIRYVTRCRPRAVAVDVLFTEPSRFGVDDDAALAEALAATGASAAAMVLGESTGSDVAWPEGLGDKGITVDGIEEWRYRDAVDYPRALFPIPEVAAAADLLGNVTLAPDPDGIYRRAPFFSLVADGVLPGMALAAHAAAKPDETIRVDDTALHVGDRRIALDDRGRAILRFRGPA